MVFVTRDLQNWVPGPCRPFIRGIHDADGLSCCEHTDIFGGEAALAACTEGCPVQCTGACNHPEVTRLWGIYGIDDGSFKNNISSTPGWLLHIKESRTLSITRDPGSTVHGGTERPPSRAQKWAGYQKPGSEGSF